MLPQCAFGFARLRRSQISSLETLITLVQEKLAARCTPEDLIRVLKYLHHIGTVIYFDKVDALKNVVVLDPQWFGLNVIGRVLAPNKDEMRAFEEPLYDGASVEEHCFEAFISTRNSQHGYSAVPPKFVPDVIRILQELQVCCRVRGAHVGKPANDNANYLVFPSVLTAPNTTAAHNVCTYSCDTPLRLGKRLLCEDACYLIPSGFFPKLQVRLREAYAQPESTFELSDLDTWYHGVYLKTHNGTEALIQQSNKDVNSRQFIDIIVWDNDRLHTHLQFCKELLDKLISLCEDQQREQHFGRVLLKQHALLPSKLFDAVSRFIAPLNDRIVIDRHASRLQEKVEQLRKRHDIPG